MFLKGISKDLYSDIPMVQLWGSWLENLNLFESMEFLEPKCPNCGTVLDYGINTRFDEKLGAHVCLKCNYTLK